MAIVETAVRLEIRGGRAGNGIMRKSWLNPGKEVVLSTPTTTPGDCKDCMRDGGYATLAAESCAVSATNE